MKTPTFLLVLLCTAFISNAQPKSSCLTLKKVYEDGKTNFNTYRGASHTSGGFGGESTWYDYNIMLWDAEEVELAALAFSSQMGLKYRYCSTNEQEEALSCFDELLEKLENCFPADFSIYKEGDTDDDQPFMYFTDSRDGDPTDYESEQNFPLVKIYVEQTDNEYSVVIEILASKKD